MKKILIVCCMTLLLLSGCGILSNTPKKQVEILLSNYQSLDEQVLNDLDYSIFFDTDLTTAQKDRYKEIMKKQYRDLTYTIKDETINGDNATVETEIEVYNLKQGLTNTAPTVLPTANMLTNEDTLTKEDNNLDNEAMDDTNNPSNNLNDGTNTEAQPLNIDTTLTNLEGTKERVKYTLNITLTKVNDKWVVDDLTTEQLQKINGVY